VFVAGFDVAYRFDSSFGTSAIGMDDPDLRLVAPWRERFYDLLRANY